MQQQKLSEHAVFIWRIRATALMVIASFLSGAVWVFSAALAIILGSLFLLTYLFLLFVYFPWLYSKCFFLLEKDAVTIEKGVLFHKRYKIPAARIQYTEFLQTPAQRMKRVYSAVFHTAGSMVMLSQISEKNVMQIKRLTGDSSVTGAKQL